MKITEKFQENFPFISVLTHADKEFVGIIINQDSNVTSFYDYELCNGDEEKSKMLELGEAWWWESNRQVPINIFLRNEIKAFDYTIRNFTTKDVKVLHGPVTSLNNIIIKRIKRKSITLVRKPS
tara:strand:+ start:437 stop:808 length:372 start_codon:yes stop_codon:yes gene_type:complete